MPKKIVVIGATSLIARELLFRYAEIGAEFFLVGRSLERLKAVAQDLRFRGAVRAETFLLDAGAFVSYELLKTEAVRLFGEIDLLFVAQGSLPAQNDCEQSVSSTLEAFLVNQLSPIALLTTFAPVFERQKRGCIAVITSVAGDRGRRTNYIYGSAKAGLTVFLQGLRARLSMVGVRVVTIKPGFVDTPMTAHMKKNLLFVSAKKVAATIFLHLEFRQTDVFYAPWYWRWMMLLIRCLPERIFKKLRF